jgi:DME family drug/metabolite transporter
MLMTDSTRPHRLTPAQRVAFGRGCVAAAAVLWSLGGVVIKSKALESLDPTSIAFYRSLFAGLALLPWIAPCRRVWRPALLPASAIFAATVGLYIAAVKATTAANAIFLQCSAVVWLVPLNLWILGERPDRRTRLGIALAAPGIAAIVLFGHGGGPRENSGVAMGLGSGIAYAGVIIALRRLRDLDPIWLSAALNLGGALSLAAWQLAADQAIARPDAGQLAGLVAFGVVQMAIPYTLFALGLREITAPEAGLIMLLEPILNPIWVVLGRGERPAAATIVGGLFLLLGVTVRYRPEPQARRQGAPRAIEAPPNEVVPVEHPRQDSNLRPTD